jgi:hypothetical protein
MMRKCESRALKGLMSKIGPYSFTINRQIQMHFSKLAGGKASEKM